MEQLTIKKLHELCEEELKKGNGEKLVLVSNDYGEYHGLNKGFDENIEPEDIYNSKTSDPQKVIVLS